MKIPLKGAEFFYTDRRTDMTKLKVAFVILLRRLIMNIELWIFIKNHKFDLKFNTVYSYLVYGKKDDSAFGGWL